ncbi:glycosyltransferase family 4 protein [Actinomadura logoneensis]|uniref:Glycosyltransferase family 4 protein n=1 Tax=Actinomadura logoneensis TaxID=2293572 RepID=A0A372JJE2_9ACTN|nr:glycosyltransferase family 4 protein [Actinomadura logoneensis]
MKDPARAVHRLVRRLVFTLLRLAARGRVRPARAERPVVRVLLQHAYGTGGTIRTVLNMCGYLARDHDIEIVSVVRLWDRPYFPVPDGVRVTVADDRRPDAADASAGRVKRLARRVLRRVPSILTPLEDASFRDMNLLTDLRLVRAVLASPADVLVGTRPSLVLLLAELAPRDVVTLGQDHRHLPGYRPALRAEILRRYGRLSVLVTLTETARDGFAEALAGTPVRIVTIPNALSELRGGLSPRTAPVVLAAGRLVRAKGFDMLIKAYAPLADKHPEWRLRIHGSGARQDRLRKQIAELGVGDRIELLPRTDIATALENASVYALSSRYEGMPLVLLEAMSKGLAVVSFDCPAGPAEMIEDGVNGLLVPARDVDALTAALDRLMSDRGLRDRLGAAAPAATEPYHLDRIGPLWIRLLDEVLTRH